MDKSDQPEKKELPLSKGLTLNRINAEKLYEHYRDILHSANDNYGYSLDIEIKGATGATIQNFMFLPTTLPENVNDYDELNTFFYIPGTAFTIHNHPISNIVASHLCEALKCRIIVVWHRLSPENKFPDPDNDILATINACLERPDLKLNKIGLAGYSSGGKLILSSWLNHARDTINNPERRVPIAQLLLIAPGVNLGNMYKLNEDPEHPDQYIKPADYAKNIDAYKNKWMNPENFRAEISPHKHEIAIAKTLPNTVTIFGQYDILKNDFDVWIETFKNLPGSNLHTEYEIPNAVHSSYWLNLSFLYRDDIRETIRQNFDNFHIPRQNFIPQFKLLPTYVCQGITPEFGPEKYAERRDLQENLSQLMNRESISNTVLTNIYGPGGTGKTWLALYYYFNIAKNKFNFLFWCNATSNEEIINSFALFADELNLTTYLENNDIRSKANKFQDWLNTNQLHYLLLLDSISENTISDYNNSILPTRNGHILFTSREKLSYCNEADSITTLALTEQDIEQIQKKLNEEYSNYSLKDAATNNKNIAAQGILAAAMSVIPFGATARLLTLGSNYIFNTLRIYYIHNQVVYLTGIASSSPLSLRHFYSYLKNSNFINKPHPIEINSIDGHNIENLDNPLKFVLININLLKNSDFARFDKIFPIIFLLADNIPINLLFAPGNNPEVWLKELEIFSVISYYNTEKTHFFVHPLVKEAIEIIVLNTFLTNRPTENKKTIISYIESFLNYLLDRIIAIYKDQNTNQLYLLNKHIHCMLNKINILKIQINLDIKENMDEKLSRVQLLIFEQMEHRTNNMSLYNQNMTSSFFARKKANSRIHNQPITQNNTPPIINSLSHQNVPHDGAGFYHAVGKIVDKKHQVLKNLTANQIRDNIQKYLPFIYLENNMSVEIYINNIRYDITNCADHVEIDALSNALKRPIVVIDNNRVVRNLTLEKINHAQSEPIFVYYTGDHYDPLIRDENVDLQTILDQLTFQLREDINQASHMQNNELPTRPHP